MNKDLIIIPSTSVTKESHYEFRQEKLWEAFPEEPLVVHSSHLGTRSYLDGDRLDEMTVTEDGVLLPGSDTPKIVGQYMSHELPKTEDNDWVQLPSFSHAKVNDEEKEKELASSSTITMSAAPIEETIIQDPMFEESYKHLGTLHVGVETSVVYKYSEQAILLKRVVSPCDCARVYNDASKRELTVKYIPKEIPIHLRHQGHYKSVKRFEVLFDLNDGTEQAASFSFEANIIK